MSTPPPHPGYAPTVHPYVPQHPAYRFAPNPQPQAWYGQPQPLPQPAPVQARVQPQYMTTRRGANHGLHVFLTVLTCGLWAVTGWPLATVIGRRTTTRIR